MTHDLKCWPPEFRALLDGTKTHEVRVHDRPFAVGDVLHLREWDPTRNGDSFSPPRGYTGRALDVEVTHLTQGGRWGLPEGVCVMSVQVRCRCIHEAGDSPCPMHDCAGCGNHPMDCECTPSRAPQESPR